MKKNLIFWLLLVLHIYTGCSRTPRTSALHMADTLVSFKVEPAPEWTNLFYRNSGWFGADGVFTVALSGSETRGAGVRDSVLMYFSDTMTGTVVADTAVDNFKMVNNSFAWIRESRPLKETTQIFYRKGNGGEALSYFTPLTPASQPREYYWTGDGFINQEDNNSLNIFGYRILDRSSASWDFEVKGVTLITVPDPRDLSRHSQVDLPLFVDTGAGKGTFGAGIYINTKAAGAPQPDGYMYVYGVLDPGKQLIVARVKPRDVKITSSWRFWNGTDWDPDIARVKPVTDRVSNELSLTPLGDGRYLLVFQADGIGNHTAIRIGKSPIGPFGPLQNIWRVPEIAEPPGLIPYNAKAHPVLSTPHRLLISYNTISADYFKDILRYPHMYRPRFIWLEIDK